MVGMWCPWCKTTVEAPRCPVCAWDERYGSVKRSCAFKDCAEPVTVRVVDAYRPVEYRSLWCDTHLATHGARTGRYEPTIEPASAPTERETK